MYTVVLIENRNTFIVSTLHFAYVSMEILCSFKLSVLMFVMRGRQGSRLFILFVCVHQNSTSFNDRADLYIHIVRCASIFIVIHHQGVATAAVTIDIPTYRYIAHNQ